jgi:nitroimidazol reductase NimA-like FMN-containing flavoprotein (pyridoxamine 5'-phosphate oxidase superfamily)
MTTYSETARTRLHRSPTRGSYDRAVVHAILDEALVCHLAFVVDGQPYGLPTTHVRDDESLFVHGSAASRMMRSLAKGVPVCLTVTLVDGLVLARSAFRHSMNYRSVVVLGTAREVTDLREKCHALSRLVDKLSPGRYERIRTPSDPELRATSVLALPLEEVSAKIRTGPPLDDDADRARPGWAGVVPIGLRAATPVADGEAAEAFERPTPPRGVLG